MAKPYVIGIDMGGTNTVFGIVDARGNVIASSSIKTGKHSDFNDYIDELHTELSRLIKDNEAEGNPGRDGDREVWHPLPDHQ